MRRASRCSRDGAPFPASHDRRHEVNAVTSYHLGPWTASATWVFASGQAYTVPESQYTITLASGEQTSYVHVGQINASRLPDYHRLDLSLSRRFETETLNCSAGLTLFNAYNHTNVQSREYDLEVSPILVTDVTMLGFTVMSQTGAITLNPKPLFWGANIVGGFIFGIGMVLAGGCASGMISTASSCTSQDDARVGSMRASGAIVPRVGSSRLKMVAECACSGRTIRCSSRRLGLSGPRLKRSTWTIR